jgi:hypothetical protein
MDVEVVFHLCPLLDHCCFGSRQIQQRRHMQKGFFRLFGWRELDSLSVLQVRYLSREMLRVEGGV